MKHILLLALLLFTSTTLAQTPTDAVEQVVGNTLAISVNLHNHYTKFLAAIVEQKRKEGWTLQTAFTPFNSGTVTLIFTKTPADK